MSLSYSEVPAGGQVHIPPAIPTAMLYRVKQIMGVSKQTVKLVSISGQLTASNGQKVIVSLPSNSLVDLATFEFNFTGATTHNGNGGVGNTNNYVQKRYFPRNSASLIENLEIKINGASRQNVNQYGYLYNILADFLMGNDCTNKNRVGCNTDPSNKTTNILGGPRRIAGYPVGLLTETAANSYLDQTDMSIRTWLGILGGNASTSIIDTSLYGDITIELTLAPDTCLMLGQVVDITANMPAIVANASDSGYPTTGGAANALVAAQTSGYTLSNIGFQITRYDMPSSYYSAVASVLESGAVFKLYYPNYSTFTGTAMQALAKAGTSRFSISTQSLDMVISTFQQGDRTTQQFPVLGDPQHTLATSASSEWGLLVNTFDYFRIRGSPKLFNNSKYFLRNGEGQTVSTYIVGAVRLIPENINEQFNGVLRAFNIQNDTLGGLYPGITSIYHYVSQFYAHILSLNVSSEHEMYTVSGLNCASTPIVISWETQPAQAANLVNVDIAANSNGNIWNGTLAAPSPATPVQFACYTSRLEISAGRNIVTYL